MLLNSISGVDLSQDWSAIKLAEVGLVIQHKPFLVLLRLYHIPGPSHASIIQEIQR